MAPPRVAPTGLERPFADEELFFSTTDEGGRIRACNDVFARVSAHPRAALLGAAHNVVRHPAMPRAVFGLLWERLRAGLPVAAYVCNLAADGGHYWVLAIAVPIEGGHLSVRLKPATPLFDAVRAIYPQVRAAEEAEEAGDPRRRKRAVAAGRERLEALLAEAGFADVEAFMHAALTAEVAAREARLPAPAHDRLGRPAPDAPRAVADVLRAAAAAHVELDRLVSRLGAYAAAGEQLTGKSAYLQGLAADVRLFSLNAMLAAARLGEDGAALGVVAGILRRCSDATTPIIGELDADIVRTVRRLGDLGSRIATAKLQVEMAMCFAHELAGGDAHGELAVLAGALDDGVRELVGALDALQGDLRGLLRHVGAVGRELGIMRALEVNGRMEAARDDHADAAVALFRAIAEQVVTARGELEDFAIVAGLAGRRDLGAEARLRREVATAAAAMAAA